MAALPDIVNGFALSRANIGILCLAFAERLTALARINVAFANTLADLYRNILSGANLALIQGKGAIYCIWWHMQYDLELFCLSCADHTSAVNPRPKFATVEDWRAVAELPSGGFRRGEDGASFGLIRKPDPIRRWVLQDIVKGLAAMQQARASCSYVGASSPYSIVLTLADISPKVAGLASFYDDSTGSWVFKGNASFAADATTVTAPSTSTDNTGNPVAIITWDFSHE